MKKQEKIETIQVWHAMDEKDVLKDLNTSTKGLTNEEAKKRLEQYGYNELKEIKKEMFCKCSLRSSRIFL